MTPDPLDLPVMQRDEIHIVLFQESLVEPVQALICILQQKRRVEIPLKFLPVRHVVPSLRQRFLAFAASCDPGVPAGSDPPAPGAP